MAQFPWWVLPLVAGVAVVGGVLVGFLLSGAARYARIRVRRQRRWETERTAAYVDLLAAFDRAVARMRVGFAAGVTEPDLLVYLDEVGPTVTRVRLLASPAVRNTALAVHRVLADMHGQRPAAGQNGKAGGFLELLDHVPLVMHELERAIRDEMDLESVARPPAPSAGWWHRIRGLRPGRRAAEPR